MNTPKLLPIARMGEEILQKKAESINLKHIEEVIPLIEDMKYTLIQQGERVGLAAPQVFVSKRLLIFRIPEKLHPRYANTAITNSIELHPLINPEIKPLSSEKEEGYEACISIPGLVGVVPRYKHIEYSYYNVHGKHHRIEASGFHARVVQHEYDHLEGILFIERVTDLKTLSFEDEFHKKSS